MSSLCVRGQKVVLPEGVVAPAIIEIKDGVIQAIHRSDLDQVPWNQDRVRLFYYNFSCGSILFNKDKFVICVYSIFCMPGSASEVGARGIMIFGCDYALEQFKPNCCEHARVN